ncbi:hypothetical protein DICVIV_04079 [Dictyocaulus viviparus]|uniref:Uncharacterized protein n=1 Tax=Dictyocaulus viviparus TaxID=29172 RepID=A0A0D8Y131_DICVI|nr:hypothetical protein DICVIV_04079 [Dictyocaulus viviparus]
MWPISRQSCENLKDLTANRCDVLKKCCPVSNSCEQQYDNLTPPLLNLKSTIDALLHGCRARMNNILATSPTKKNKEMAAEFSRATTAIINLIRNSDASTTNGKASITPTAYFGTKVKPGTSIPQNLDQNSKRNLRTKSMKRQSNQSQLINLSTGIRRVTEADVHTSPSPYNVKLIIDRMFPTYNQPTIQPISMESRGSLDYQHPFFRPTEELVPFRSSTDSSKNDHNHKSLKLLPKRNRPQGITEGKLQILEPQRHATLIIDRWTSDPKRTMTFVSPGITRPVIKPWNGDSTSVIRPNTSFRAQAIRFPDNLELLTDIAIPHQNRLTNKQRQNKKKSFVKTFKVPVISATTTTKRPLKNYPQKEVVIHPTADEIYEDIVQQQLEPHSVTDNIPVSDVDFEDISIPEKAEHSGNSILTSSISEAIQRRSIDQRIDKESFRRYLSLSTEDPLDAPILVRPLTNNLEELRKMSSSTLVKSELLSSDAKLKTNYVDDEAASPTMTTIAYSTNSSYHRPTTLTTSTSSLILLDRSSVPLPYNSQSALLEKSAIITPSLENISLAALRLGDNVRSTIVPASKNHVAVEGSSHVVNRVNDSTLLYYTDKVNDSTSFFDTIKVDNSTALFSADKVNGTTSLIGTTGSDLSSLISPKTASTVVDHLWPQKKLTRSKAFHSSKRQPHVIKISSIHKTAPSNESATKKFSILKLSETTLRLSHCEAYILCLDELSREQKHCQIKVGRFMPGLPNRRRGFCYESLLIDYQAKKCPSNMNLLQALDEETRNLEERYTNCIKNRLGQNITEVEPSKCAVNSLPTTLRNEPCHSKLHVLKHHCSKLAGCCPDSDLCREKVNKSDESRILRRKKELLSLEVTKCQIDSVNKYNDKSLQLTTIS